MRKTERTANTNTVATVADGVEMDPGNIAETVAAANPLRLYMAITVLEKESWIRLIPAATDPTTRKGIRLDPDTTYEMLPDNIYTGEVSIINANGSDQPEYFLTEY